MKKQFLLCIAAVLSLTSGYSQSKNAWTPVKAEQAATMGEISQTFAIAKNNISFVTVNVNELKSTLSAAPQKNSGGAGVEIILPNVKGGAEHFIVLEASNFSPALQAQFPDIRSYVGTGVEDPTAHLRLSMSPKGIQTMVLRGDKKTEFIEPYTTNSEVYAVFNSGVTRAEGELPFNCTTADDHDMQRITSPAANRAALSDAQVFKTLRLALSCTGEYAQFHGGTVAGALAGMNATMTRVNGVYEVDLAVNLILIDDEANIIFTDSDTDPYTSAIVGNGAEDWNDQLQGTLTSTIGAEAYDIGHLVGTIAGSGNAGCIGCVCVNNRKGRGWTAASNTPEGDSFDIDYVAHEMGHQLGANHTYSYSYEGSGAQTEPGSGSSIMGYAGITGSYDVQLHSDDYFTYSSLRQIQNNLANKPCPVTTILNNPEMVVNAGANYSIPKGTAFVLKAVGADVNPESLTYNWEQNDSSTDETAGDISFAIPTKTDGPIFRSVAPGTSTSRYFPAFSNVVRNALTTKWESVSNVGRMLHFTLTGRDNVAGGGQTDTDEADIIVEEAAGPFIVTSQNNEAEAWAVGSQQTITWNVAGTTANNINVANVNILLSTDAGETFTTLLANTSNDGSEVITVPATASGVHCRIMVESVGNVFYALNQKEFSIGYTVTNNCTTYTNSMGLNIPDNRSSFTSQNLAIAAPGVTVSKVKVVVNATHPYLGDLIINIVNPSGTVVNLWDKQCNASDNLNITFAEFNGSVVCASPTTGTYIPQESLAAFAGSNANGNWKLRVRDTARGDTGNINSWSVIVCTETLTPLSTDSFGLKEFAIFPNPNSGSFTVQFNSESQNKINIIVNDLSGRVVYNSAYANTGVFSGNVNLQNVQQGVYLVTVQDGIRKESRKIVIK
jgi:subtilisin-like proprotein convertase family protein